MKALKAALISSSSLLALLSASCVSSGPPAPVSSDHVEVTGGGFGLNGKNKAQPFQETISYKLKSGTQVPAYGNVTFENPSDSGRPFRKAVVFRKPNEELSVESPSFSRITNNRRYWVDLDLYSDSAKTQKIDSIRQENLFSMPPAILNQLGVGDKVD